MYLGMYVVPTGIVCFLHNTTVLILKFWKFAKSLKSLGLRCHEREMSGEAKEACAKKRHTMWSLRVILLKGKSIFAPSPSDGTLSLVPRRASLFPHHMFSPQHLLCLYHLASIFFPVWPPMATVIILILLLTIWHSVLNSPFPLFITVFLLFENPLF